jgi:hypothetical protein
MAAAQDAWELRSVLLLWLGLLLTVPFALSALSPDTPSSFDKPSANVLFPKGTPSLTRSVAQLAIPLLSRPGKEGSNAALVLARLYSRPDTADQLEGFFAWARKELSEGDVEGEANLVSGLLEMLALLPGMVSIDYLDGIQGFHVDLVNHLRGGRTSASSGLIRKLAVKAAGRWWVARLSGSGEYNMIAFANTRHSGFAGRYTGRSDVRTSG